MKTACRIRVACLAIALLLLAGTGSVNAEPVPPLGPTGQTVDGLGVTTLDSAAAPVGAEAGDNAGGVSDSAPPAIAMVEGANTGVTDSINPVAGPDVASDLSTIPQLTSNVGDNGDYKVLPGFSDYFEMIGSMTPASSISSAIAQGRRATNPGFVARLQVFIRDDPEDDGYYVTVVCIEIQPCALFALRIQPCALFALRFTLF